MMNWLLRSLCKRVYKSGSLAVTDPNGQIHEFGDGSGKPVHFAIRSARAERAIVVNPRLAVPEAFMEGEFEMVEGDLLDFLELTYNNAAAAMDEGIAARLAEAWRYAMRRFHQFNPAGRSRRNVSHHYDLSGDLYRLFLDEDMQYSCGYFETPDTALDEAQLAKKRHIAAKLKIEPGQDILDIGSGWGGLGLFLAQQEANIRGVTLSTEQLSVSRQRAEELQLQDRARFDLEDYRNVEGPFDRIVSVGMFEHVGVNHYRAYFDKCAQLLKRDGVMLLHTIGRSSPPAVTNAFIRKYIFPGGYIPALSEIVPHIERAGLIITDIEILRLHYADTLRNWRERFMANRDKAVALYDEKFARMWEFYLAGSEAAFRWQDMVVFQIQLARRVDSLPVTRDYIATTRDGYASAVPNQGRRGFKDAAE